MNSRDDQPVLDPRPWFITICFVQITLSASLFIFLLMENGAESSFLGLAADLMSYSKLSATILAAAFVFVIVSVISIWIRNARLLTVASSISTILVLLLAFVLVWVVGLSNGHWQSTFERSFNTSSINVQNLCPTLPGARCCGWEPGACSVNCTHYATDCKSVIHNDVEDFAVRVIPITAIIGLVGLIGAAVSFMSRSWVNSVGPPQSGEYDVLH